jgi:hypothetical protein
MAAAQVAEHLAAAETARRQADAARAEAEALRKATLAITQNLRMRGAWRREVARGLAHVLAWQRFQPGTGRVTA